MKQHTLNGASMSILDLINEDDGIDESVVPEPHVIEITEPVMMKRVKPNSNPVFKFALREDLKEEKQFLPTRGEPKATGWDVRAAMENRKPLVIKPLEHIKIPLGIRGFCPNDWWYELKPRSSTFGKKNLHALYGTIDETYEGELVFACQYIPSLEYSKYNGPISWEIYHNSNTLEINFGDAIGQIVPVKRVEMIVAEITNEEYDTNSKQRDAVRKAGGFGSTGA